MAETTKIQWCDATFNPWRGCSKVSTGCKFCYAEREAKRFPANRGIWGPNGTRVKASDAMWREPVKWNREAEKAGVRRRVFCASLADVFEDWTGEVRDHRGLILHRCRAGHETGLEAVYAHGAECWAGCNRATHPVTLDDLRRKLFALIDSTSWLDWLLLTKRPENIRRMWQPIAGGCGGESCCFYRSNTWLITSVAEQADADRNLPHLLACRDLVPVLGVSAEPLVGPVKLSPWLPQLDWVIGGSESGHGRRPMSYEWALSLYGQCANACVPFFMKQMEVGGKVSGEISEFPAAVAVRQFPGPAGTGGRA